MMAIVDDYDYLLGLIWSTVEYALMGGFLQYVLLAIRNV